MGNKEFIKFGHSKSPIFREKAESKIEIPPLSFSEEKDNDEGLGEKRIDLLNKNTKEEIGSIYFDYPKKDTEKLLKVRGVGMVSKYKGHNLSIKLFERLLSLAKKKNLEGIKSDDRVQGGAMIIVKKLQDKGYDARLHSDVQDKYDEFLQKYKEGKYFQGLLSVPVGDSVFEVHLKEK